jgi:hypothetical protein
LRRFNQSRAPDRLTGLLTGKKALETLRLSGCGQLATVIHHLYCRRGKAIIAEEGQGAVFDFMMKLQISVGDWLYWGGRSLCGSPRLPDGFAFLIMFSETVQVIFLKQLVRK